MRFDYENNNIEDLIKYESSHPISIGKKSTFNYVKDRTNSVQVVLSKEHSNKKSRHSKQKSNEFGMGPWEEELLQDKPQNSKAQRQVYVELPSLGNTL